jgi:hypothetical protein
LAGKPRISASSGLGIAAHVRLESRFSSLGYRVSGPNALDNLRKALADIASTDARPTTQQRADLESRVCAVVDHMKADGAPPESVVVLVKNLATAAGIRWSSETLFDDVVGWCIQRYFRLPRAD